MVGVIGVEGCITPRKGVRDFFGSTNPWILGPDLLIFQILADFSEFFILLP